jgi:hypothetical protein
MPRGTSVRRNRISRPLPLWSRRTQSGGIRASFSTDRSMPFTSIVVVVITATLSLRMASLQLPFDQRRNLRANTLPRRANVSRQRIHSGDRTLKLNLDLRWDSKREIGMLSVSRERHGSRGQLTHDWCIDNPKRASQSPRIDSRPSRAESDARQYATRR